MASAALQAFVDAQAGDVAALAVSAEPAPVEAAPVALSVVPGVPVVSAEPAAAAGLPAEQGAALTARGLVEAEPAAALCVVAAVASAPAAVVNDALAPAVFDFAGAAGAEIEPAVARQHAVAAVTELFVDAQPLSAPAVVDAAIDADPADGFVGPLVGPLPGRSRLELFADPIAVDATPVFAVARFGRRGLPVSPGRPFVARVPAQLQG